VKKKVVMVTVLVAENINYFFILEFLFIFLI